MSDVMKGQLRFLNLFYCHLMTTTPEPTVMDLTKVANVCRMCNHLGRRWATAATHN